MRRRCKELHNDDPKRRCTLDEGHTGTHYGRMHFGNVGSWVVSAANQSFKLTTASVLNLIDNEIHKAAKRRNTDRRGDDDDMDPDANLREQKALTELLQDMISGEEHLQGFIDSTRRLCELVDSLDTWIKNGGALPKEWGQNKKFTLYWLCGKKEIVEGQTPEEAIMLAGYGAGAMPALDFWAAGEDDDYIWTKDGWQKK